MNFSKIHYQTKLGKLLRLPLRLIPKCTVLPILQGKLRGKKWIVGAGEHGYWLGSYELRKREAFEGVISPGSVVFDVGANVGYYSLLAAVLAGKMGRVYAFEPLPRNVKYLRRHVALNKMKNIEVIEAAVSDHEGEGSFDLGASTAMGHLAEVGEIKVHMVSLDGLFKAGEIQAPNFIKIDVEGAEAAVVRGAFELLQICQPVLFLDTHHRKAHEETITFLERLGYTFEILDGKPLSETRELVAWPQNHKGERF